MGSPFDGEAAISPGGRLCPAWMCAHKMQRHACSLLTVAAIQKDSHDKRFFAVALTYRDHMFSQALRLMAR